jgi:hypothetical protein
VTRRLLRVAFLVACLKCHFLERGPRRAPKCRRQSESRDQQKLKKHGDQKSDSDNSDSLPTVSGDDADDEGELHDLLALQDGDAGVDGFEAMLDRMAVGEGPTVTGTF